jgi:hypothetical protein
VVVESLRKRRPVEGDIVLGVILAWPMIVGLADAARRVAAGDGRGPGAEDPDSDVR